MIKISELIAALQQFPPDALAYAYEGEITAVVVRAPDDSKQLGFVYATGEPESQPLEAIVFEEI